MTAREKKALKAMRTVRTKGVNSLILHVWDLLKTSFDNGDCGALDFLNAHEHEIVKSKGLDWVYYTLKAELNRNWPPIDEHWTSKAMIERAKKLEADKEKSA